MIKRLLYSGKLCFLFIFLAFGIIIHHYFKHKNDDGLDILSKFVQWKDINNHETLALFFLGIGVGLYIAQCLL